MARTPVRYIRFHQDGSVWAKGQMLDGLMTGYWEWFRKNGVRLRSGHFAKGEQVGEWITYNAGGKVHKVTQMLRARGMPKVKAKAKVKSKAKAKPKVKAQAKAKPRTKAKTKALAKTRSKAPAKFQASGRR